MRDSSRHLSRDDNPLNDWVAPWLSSISIHYGTFGQAVAELITSNRMGASRQRVLPHRLIERRRSYSRPISANPERFDPVVM